MASRCGVSFRVNNFSPSGACGCANIYVSALRKVLSRSGSYMKINRHTSVFSFYGWRVLFISSLMGSMVVGLTISGFPVFFIKIREDLGLSNTEVSLVLALAWAQSGIVAPLFGWIVDHSGARKLVLWGGITCGVGLVLVSRSDQLWELIIFYSVIIAVGRTACVNPTLMAVVNQWFVRNDR